MRRQEKKRQALLLGAFPDNGIGALAFWGVLVGLLDAAEVLIRVWQDRGFVLSDSLEIARFIAGTCTIYGAIACVFALLTLVTARGMGLVSSTSRPPWWLVVGPISAVLALPLLVWGNIGDSANRRPLEPLSLTLDVLILIVAGITAIAIARVLDRHSLMGRVTRAGKVLLPATAILATVLVVVPGISRTAAPGSAEAVNLLVIGIDTLRADHLSVYGYSRPTSPNIDELAARGVLWEICISPSSSTAPAHASLWTGTYPHVHGVRRNGQKLAETSVTLAEVLADRGYQTVGFVTNGLIDARHGFDQGFEIYTATGGTDLFSDPSFEKATQLQWWYSIKVVALFGKLSGTNLVTKQVRRYLLQEVRQPFFLFVQFLEPHAPYTPPEDLIAAFRRTNVTTDGSMRHLRDIQTGRVQVTSNEVRALEDLYDAEIRRVDIEVGRVLQVLKESGLSQNTLVVFWADHGENMYEHEHSPGWQRGRKNVFDHLPQLYDSLVHVPLIASWPGRLPEGKRVRGVVGTVEIKEMILSFLGSPSERGGRLDTSGEELFGEALFGETRAYSVRDGDWKLIRYESLDGVHLADELFQLSKDLGEVKNLAGVETKRLRNLESRLERWIEVTGDNTLSVEANPTEAFDEETIRRLKALGYID